MTEENTQEFEEIQPRKKNRKKKHKKNKKKLSKTGKTLINVLLVICLGVVAFSGYHLVQALLTYKQSRDLYKEISDQAKNTTIEEGSEEEVITIDWDYLYSVNADIMGWIKLEDSTVDYPIVYGYDNDFYLRHSLNGDYNIMGTVFVDYRNQRDLLDKVTVIYGHHTYDDTMFTDIGKYKDQSYYDTHKVISLEMPNGSYDLYPVAGYTCSAYDDYIQYSFESDEAFMNYVNDFMTKSQFQGEQTVSLEDRCILLSTCSHDIEDGRFALLLKVVQKDTNTESTPEPETPIEEVPVEEIPAEEVPAVG